MVVGWQLRLRGLVTTSGSSIAHASVPRTTQAAECRTAVL